MTILLVSLDEELYMQTVKLVEHRGEVKRCSAKQVEEFLQRDSVAFVILDLDIGQIRKADYRLIIRIKSMQNVPILTVMRQDGVSDILNVLKIGAMDYLERTKMEQQYPDKIDSMFRWHWYFKCKENREKSIPKTKTR